MKKLMLLVLITAAVLASCTAFPISVYGNSSSTSLKTDQLTYEVNVGELLNVTVLVENVTDLYTWQVMLFYDADLIQCVDAFLPSDHVFAGQPYVPVEPVIDNVDNGSVLYGCSLMGAAEPFSGSGKLCVFTFNGTAVGLTTLHFSTPYGEDTFLLNYDMDTIPAEVIDGSVNVIPEFPSTLAFAMLIPLTTLLFIYWKRSRKRWVH